MARYRPAAGAKEAKTRGTPTKSRAATEKHLTNRFAPHGGRGLFSEGREVDKKRAKHVDKLMGQVRTKEKAIEARKQAVATKSQRARGVPLRKVKRSWRYVSSK